ncbi:MAG: ATP-binding cassette domain-containing protein [Lachnospiraceae bacterium]|nr:ATP-binding cassette domain-containing protein [Lachnospiraceae bacterium]
METTYIEVCNLTKTYSAKNGNVAALKSVSLSIPKNEIFGVIGLSGAGKSTLVRCLNLLERPDSGDVFIDGQNLMTLGKEQLRLRRQKIGMIFQHFNLLEQQNVLENVCFPMEIRGIPARQRKEKAMELLKKVGLTDKADAYSSQLSGGQKQRVAIARVLANEPDILLCDEATSALDPETTKTILDLLKSIHDTMGITMVIITHEMRVIQEICTKVAVLDQGVVQECGSVTKIFNNPKSGAARRLLLMRETEGMADVG